MLYRTIIAAVLGLILLPVPSFIMAAIIVSAAGLATPLIIRAIMATRLPKADILVFPHADK